MAADILEHHLPYTEPVNEVVGGPIVGFFESMGIERQIFGELVVAYNDQYPLPDHTLQATVIILLMVGVTAYLTRRMDRVPGPLQTVLEAPVLGLRDMMENIIGHGGGKYLPFMFTVASFIFVSNMIGLFPYAMSPTSNINVTFGLGLMSFCYYNFHGIKENGVINYVAHFFGPKLPWYMTPINLLMFPIELISHMARPLSLGLRLFGNIMGEDIVLLVLISLVPLVVPMPMMALMIFTGFLQAFVFIILSILYVAGAVAEEH